MSLEKNEYKNSNFDFQQSNFNFENQNEKEKSHSLDLDPEESQYIPAELIPAITHENDPFLVTFDNDKDPENPMNWSMKKKIIHTLLFGMATLGANLNASILSPATSRLQEYFHVSRVVIELELSLYLLGVGIGPLVLGPLSEVYGRKYAVLIPLIMCGMMTAATASSEKIESFMITRFFAGLLSSSPTVNSGGVLSDIWNPAFRGYAIILYGLCVVSGPTVAPTFGSLILGKDEDKYGNIETNWRWPCWFIVAYFGVIAIILFFCVEETFHPIILARKARRLRLSTREWAYHARHEEWEFTLKEFFKIHFVKPIELFFTPIAFLISLYGSFVYGLIFLSISSIFVAFREIRGWSNTNSSVVIIAFFVGELFGSIVNIYSSRRYSKLIKLNNNKPLPEERLMSMMIGGWLIPTGLFILGWTSKKSIHWMLPIFGLFLIGVGFFTIFQNCINYLIDSFTKYSSSALTLQTFMRSCMAASFPLFGPIMFENIGMGWGCSILGFMGLALVPIPFVFYKYGERIRIRHEVV